MASISKSTIRNKLILFCIILVVLGISCRFFTSTPTPMIEPRHPWITKWLQNPTCQPPCWENITPGVTGMYEAYELLPQIPGVKVTFPPVKNPFDNSKQMQWQLDGSDSTGIADSDELGELITLLTLTVGSDQLLTVEEVISSYGSPSEVVITGCREELFRKSCVTHLVYADLGIVLDIFLIDVGDDKPQVEVLPDSGVEKIVLFPSGDEYYQMFWPNGKQEGYFFQWNGFKVYP